MNKQRSLFIVMSIFIAVQSPLCKAESTVQNILKQSEKLIDTLYSFNPQSLNAALTTAASSKPTVLFYQGWAQGGHYKIVNRMPCVKTETEDINTIISCSITVKDDLMKALGIAFDVTDTFHLTFIDASLNKVTTSSNDLQVFRDAQRWVWKTHPDWITIPCKGYFDGGLTPEKCVKEMVKGYVEFANSTDFPKSIEL
jgi:hypothetical protein